VAAEDVAGGVDSTVADMRLLVSMSY
jgi:hypothetical protein